MRNLKTLMLTLVLCAGIFVISSCEGRDEGGSPGTVVKKPVDVVKKPVEKVAAGCPCCPPPFMTGTFGADMLFEATGTADRDRVRTGRHETSSSQGTFWATRDHFSSTTAFDSVAGCCICFYYSATATRTVNGTSPVAFGTDAAELGSVEFDAPSRGTAYVTVIANVIKSTSGEKPTQAEFTLEMSQPGVKADVVSQSAVLDIPVAAAGEEGATIKFRKSFTVNAASTVFTLRSAAGAGDPADRIGTRVIHVTFLPDLE